MSQTNAPSDTNRPARLILEDASLFRGTAFGAPSTAIAEVVFNTAMTGYQESLTDPSYTAQILVETFPMIGIVGVNPADEESAKVQVAGLVVRELVHTPSNYRATSDLHAYLARHDIPGIAGVDTREITRRVRTTGAMRGAICSDPSISDADLLERIRSAPQMSGQNLAEVAGCSAPASWEETLGDWDAHVTADVTANDGRPLRVLALDCGAKRNILRNFTQRGCQVRVIPHDMPAGEIKALFDAGEGDGLFVSNGPGDPAAVEKTIQTLRELLKAEPPIPTFGICLGHQLLALALGATTYKLKFGHRGANQPVLSTLSGHVEITSQNHGFAVDRDSLEAIGAEPTHKNLNDETLAGFRLKDRPVLAVQHHPEASPGPHDASSLFDTFIEMMRTGKPAQVSNLAESQR